MNKENQNELKKLLNYWCEEALREKVSKDPKEISMALSYAYSNAIQGMAATLQITGPGHLYAFVSAVDKELWKTVL